MVYLLPTVQGGKQKYANCLGLAKPFLLVSSQKNSRSKLLCCCYNLMNVQHLTPVWLPVSDGHTLVCLDVDSVPLIQSSNHSLSSFPGVQGTLNCTWSGKHLEKEPATIISEMYLQRKILLFFLVVLNWNWIHFGYPKYTLNISAQSSQRKYHLSQNPVFIIFWCICQQKSKF